MDNNELHIENQFLGSGWSFPVTFRKENHSLAISKYIENVNQSIFIINNTNFGERCLLPTFGSVLQQFIFRTIDETLFGEISEALKTTLLHNEPRINVEEVDVTISDELNTTLNISVYYKFNETNSRHNYVFPFHLNEGTNLQH